MRIILLGAPGSGKSTQAQFILKKYNIVYISTGKILRDAVQSSSHLGLQIKNIIDSGHLVNDKLIITLVEKRINQNDCHNGFLFDGFPRTISQANALKDNGIKIDYVLELVVPDIIITKRITGRRVHFASGRNYHIIFNPPNIKDRDNITGERLSIRQDDQENSVRSRLKEYHKYTKPVIDYYLQESYTGNTRYFKIDGNRQVNQIYSELDIILS